MPNLCNLVSSKIHEINVITTHFYYINGTWQFSYYDNYIFKHCRLIRLTCAKVVYLSVCYQYTCNFNTQSRNHRAESIQRLKIYYKFHVSLQTVTIFFSKYRTLYSVVFYWNTRDCVLMLHLWRGITRYKHQCVGMSMC